ncbi:MAG TPA: hypothetical protein PLB62_00555 [Candidatus Sumerlaeota bacterium]|nr:hypothetical protein [Candidatus Sumerlaeota bacterium]
MRKMNYLHPIYQEYSYRTGSRIDIARILPNDPGDEDEELLLDMLSEPPRYIERIAPVSIKIGQELIRGKNWTELTVKGFRIFARIFDDITAYVKQTMQDVFKEKGMTPFCAVGIDPDTLHRILELDFELNENTYGKLMELYSRGVIAPSVTTPFHAILPMLKNDFDVRLLVRIGFLYYWPILKAYHEHIREVHGERGFVVCFWLPEGGYSQKVMDIIFEEFMAACKADKIKDPHLAILLDNAQAEGVDNDLLMKTWNVVIRSQKEREFISVIFKDRHFSDWVTFSNPSVKKLLDRSIAKMDSELNEGKVDYCWAHFEDIAALTYTVKAAGNFEQKVIKLTELGYLPLSPDVFIRRKLIRRYGRCPGDPNIVTLKDGTAWSDWHLDNISLGRWEGTLDSNSEYKLVDENHPYIRVTKDGDVEEPGPQCWKLALNRAIEICADAVKGDPETLKGGMLEVLASLVPGKDKAVIHSNVEEFLTRYALLHWREHFLQHNYEEADLQIQEIVNEHLLKGFKPNLDTQEYAIAAVAAQAYYFCLDARKSTATYWENLDQRAVYQNITMLVLGIVNAIHVHHWRKKQDEAKKLTKILKEELIGFETAYERYNLAEFGITEVEWRDAIESAIEDSPMNIVERAARRTAARHLRPLGYRKEFSIDDENIPTNVGHVWSGEVINTNYNWENRIFCGLHEM